MALVDRTLEAFIKFKATGIRTISPAHDELGDSMSARQFPRVDGDELLKRLKDNGSYDEMRNGIIANGNKPISINGVWRLSKLAIETLVKYRDEVKSQNKAF